MDALRSFRAACIPRALPLALVGLAAGAMIGTGAARDIRDSLEVGRIGTRSAAAPAPAAEPSPASAAAAPVEALDDEIGEAFGFTLASRLRLADPAQCADLRPKFRDGCEAYVEARGAGQGL